MFLPSCLTLVNSLKFESKQHKIDYELKFGVQFICKKETTHVGITFFIVQLQNIVSFVPISRKSYRRNII